MGLGPGIRKKPIPDPGPGVKKAPDPGSGSATLKTTIFLFKLEFGTLFSLLQDKNFKYS